MRVEDLGFAALYSRHTRRFEDLVARLCEYLPVENVAWKTVKEIDKRALQRAFAEPDYYGLRLLAIDEISYKKRHKYLTLDLEQTRVVWVGKGRRQATLEAFFDEIGEETAHGVEAIATPAKALVPGVDMWAPYIAAIEDRAPQDAIVFDKFHVIRNYSKVIDRVRIPVRTSGRCDEFKKAEKEDTPS